MPRCPTTVPRYAWLLSLAVGCASAVDEEELVVPEAADPLSSVEHTVLADEVSPDGGPDPTAADDGPACTWPKTKPRRPSELSAPPKSARCRPAPARKRAAELRRVVREQWMWSWPDHAKLSVKMGCDRLAPMLSSVTVELSSGHGGSLDLVRLEHRDDGDWDVARIDYNHYYGVGAKAGEPGDPWVEDSTGYVRLYTGVLPADRVDRALLRARQALALEIVEEEPPPADDGTIGLGSFGGSSRDFHVAFRLIDSEGHGADHYFGGYESSGDGQAHQLALDLAGGELWELLNDEPLTEGLRRGTNHDPALRELFAERFWAAHARGDDYGMWYVRERLLGLAAPLGDQEHVPALLEQVGSKEGSSEDRSRVLAINAMAAITGFDVRYGEHHVARPVGEVAADVLAACGE